MRTRRRHAKIFHVGARRFHHRARLVRLAARVGKHAEPGDAPQRASPAEGAFREGLQVILRVFGLPLGFPALRGERRLSLGARRHRRQHRRRRLPVRPHEGLVDHASHRDALDGDADQNRHPAPELGTLHELARAVQGVHPNSHVALRARRVRKQRFIFFFVAVLPRRRGFLLLAASGRLDEPRLRRRAHLQLRREQELPVAHEVRDVRQTRVAHQKAQIVVVHGAVGVCYASFGERPLRRFFAKHGDHFAKRAAQRIANQTLRPAVRLRLRVERDCRLTSGRGRGRPVTRITRVTGFLLVRRLDAFLRRVARLVFFALVFSRLALVLDGAHVPALGDAAHDVSRVVRQRDAHAEDLRHQPADRPASKRRDVRVRARGRRVRVDVLRVSGLAVLAHLQPLYPARRAKEQVLGASSVRAHVGLRVVPAHALGRDRLPDVPGEVPRVVREVHRQVPTQTRVVVLRRRRAAGVAARAQVV